MDDKKIRAILVFFEQGIVKDLESIVDYGNEEKSAITTYKALECLIQVKKSSDSNYRFESAEDYILKVYGNEFFKDFIKRYNKELQYYQHPDKPFEDIFGN